MSKIKQLKTAGEKKKNEVNEKEHESNIRVEKLSQTLFEGINKALGQDQFSHFEITDALLRVAHHYNKRALQTTNEI